MTVKTAAGIIDCTAFSSKVTEYQFSATPDRYYTFSKKSVFSLRTTNSNTIAYLMIIDNLEDITQAIPGIEIPNTPKTIEVDVDSTYQFLTNPPTFGDTDDSYGLKHTTLPFDDGVYDPER